jgi:hypothetical protein
MTATGKRTHRFSATAPGISSEAQAEFRSNKLDWRAIHRLQHVSKTTDGRTAPREIIDMHLKVLTTQMFSAGLARLVLPVVFLCAGMTVAAATYTVTNTNDNGDGSLRQATLLADLTSENDVIVFAIQGCPNNVCRIVLTSGQFTIRAAGTAGTLSVVNSSGPGSLVISGNNASPIFLGLLYSTLFLRGITVEQGIGGGIRIDGGDVRISNSVIQRCSGSGIVGWGTIQVEDSEIKENTSPVGGGIQFYGWELVIRRSEIRQNTAGYGGGIRLHGDGGISIYDSTIAENVASGWGGGMDVFPSYGAGVVLVNSTVSGNTAGGFGGGLSLTGFGKYGWTALSITNATVTDNSAGEGGGIDGYCGVSVRNSIVAGNHATSFPDINPTYAAVNNLGNNFLGGGSPLLGALANNGGSTQTHALLPGSPAINAGNNCVLVENGCDDGNPMLPRDQRGVARRGNVDIGAFEFAVPKNIPFDFDGDRRSDVSVFRPADSIWYLNRSTAGFYATQFGLATDDITPADYDGDGRTDIAVFRNGMWWLMNSSAATVQSFRFGQTGDIPVPADYTGDGDDDLGVYRSGQWLAVDIVDGETPVINFGLASDTPVPADYDGDGRVDQAVYRNGEWHLNRSNLGYTVIRFGLPTDTPVVADYDGDVKADLAVYRDGAWYLQQSTAGFAVVQWGLSTDVPVPGDYDGDGKTDASVFRDGTWYQRNSTGGIFIQQFGLTGDKPLAASFIE